MALGRGYPTIISEDGAEKLLRLGSHVRRHSLHHRCPEQVSRRVRRKELHCGGIQIPEPPVGHDDDRVRRDLDESPVSVFGVLQDVPCSLEILLLGVRLDPALRDHDAEAAREEQEARSEVDEVLTGVAGLDPRIKLADEIPTQAGGDDGHGTSAHEDRLDKRDPVPPDDVAQQSQPFTADSDA